MLFSLVYLITGILIWLAARDSYHIGASGLVYGYAAFLFVSGVIRKNTQLAALSLFVAFLYGGMVWGIFPHPIKLHISWESHLYGLLTRGFIAVYFRKRGPKPKKYEWEDEEKNDQIDDSSRENQSFTIRYEIKEKK